MINKLSIREIPVRSGNGLFLSFNQGLIYNFIQLGSVNGGVKLAPILGFPGLSIGIVIDWM